jgi:hypothetical protein
MSGVEPSIEVSYPETPLTNPMIDIMSNLKVVGSHLTIKGIDYVIYNPEE